MESAALKIGSICMLIFLVGILYEFGGFEKSKKAIKFVIALYITVAMIKSVQNVQLKINLPEDLDTSVDSEYVYDFKREVIARTQDNIEILIKKRLDEKKLSYNQVSVHILEQNGNLTASEIIIKSEGSGKDLIYECISDIADDETKIYIGE